LAIERRLTAILAADVAGYSRLTGLDEEGTHVQLAGHLRSLVDPKIAEHRGRIVKNTGDGLLAEFSSVVDAVRCAVEIQQGMAERNAEASREKRIEFRIGINVGDVMIERGDIFGDGVNVAARLEGIAEPGGICVSGRVLEDVQGKLDILFGTSLDRCACIERGWEVPHQRSYGLPWRSLTSHQSPFYPSRTSVVTRSRSISRMGLWKTSRLNYRVFLGCS